MNLREQDMLFDAAERFAKDEAELQRLRAFVGFALKQTKRFQRGTGDWKGAEVDEDRNVTFREDPR